MAAAFYDIELFPIPSRVAKLLAPDSDLDTIMHRMMVFLRRPRDLDDNDSWVIQNRESLLDAVLRKDWVTYVSLSPEQIDNGLNQLGIKVWWASKDWRAGKVAPVEELVVASVAFICCSNPDWGLDYFNYAAHALVQYSLRVSVLPSVGNQLLYVAARYVSLSKAACSLPYVLFYVVMHHALGTPLPLGFPPLPYIAAEEVGGAVEDLRSLVDCACQPSRLWAEYTEYRDDIADPAALDRIRCSVTNVYSTWIRMLVGGRQPDNTSMDDETGHY